MGECPAEVCIRTRIEGFPVPFAWSTVVLGDLDRLYSIRGFWNKQGGGRGSLKEAHEIDVDRSGNLLIVDSQSSRILRYTADGTFLDELGLGPGTKPGEFGVPRDVKVDPDSGEAYVVDGENCRVQVFDHEGNFARCWGQRGSGPCNLEGPHSIELAPDGLLYVADVGNSRVSVFDRDGSHVRSWGSCGTECGEFLAPHGIASDPNGDIFVAEYKGRCQKFTPEGEFLFEFGNQCVQEDATHGDCRYHAISSDDRGNVYLMARDTLNRFHNTIDKYNNQGDMVTRICYPIDDAHWMGAKGAVILPNGSIYVADNQRDHAGVTIFDPI